jgi:hypothetical protein
MVDEKPKKKPATPSQSGWHWTLESNPQKSDVWWIDPEYNDKVPPIALNEPRTKQFVAYRSFLIGKGLNEYDGQTLRYLDTAHMTKSCLRYEMLLPIGATIYTATMEESFLFAPTTPRYNTS